MRLLLPIILLFLVITQPLAAAINFPVLTGRVVDDAHILSQSTVSTLTQELDDYERGTSNQVVVATIKSLGGNSIEEYGYQLGRHWQIGQKEKDNGVLLIVAPNERKVRIEVGYGLEGILTDAISSQIIQTIILPDFKSGNMEKGITSGTEAIIAVLGGKGIPAITSNDSLSVWEVFFILLYIFLFIKFAAHRPILAALLSTSPTRFSSSRYDGWSGSGGSSSNGGFSGGSFSGGGGSFGGGGSSGSW